MRFIVFIFLAPVLGIFGAAFGWSAGSETMLGLGGIAVAAVIPLFLGRRKFVANRIEAPRNVLAQLRIMQLVR